MSCSIQMSLNKEIEMSLNPSLLLFDANVGGFFVQHSLICLVKTIKNCPTEKISSIFDLE